MKAGAIWLLLLMLAASVAILAHRCHSATVTLAWDPSPSTNRIVDYQVYWGPSSRFYTNHISAGTNMTVVVTNLLPARTYFFAATATDNFGQESGFSAEVSTTTPAASTNIVSVSVSIQTSPTVTGPWTNWLALPVRTVTNPPVPTYYRSVMGITNAGTGRKVLKVDSATLVFTNK